MSASTNFSIKQRLVIEFLTQNIATGDEPWVHRYDPENNRQSMEYRHPGSPIVKKFKTFPSAKKNHAHHLLGCKGVLYTEFLTKGSTVNSDRYCATLWNTQATHPQNQAGKNTFLLHHDNARPHYGAQTQDAMACLKFTVVPHPPYSPDLAPSDFWLFPEFKETLKCQHFSSDAEVEAAVRKWLSSQRETFFTDGMQKWIEQMKKKNV